MAHACGDYSVEGFLTGKSPKARALWDSLVELVGTCGDFEFAPAKTRVAFMVRVRFMAVTSVSDRGLTFHLWLRRPVDSPRFFRIDHPSPKAFIHWARVTSPDQLDAELREWVCASYLVGMGKD
ncbi:MAG: DUF5655 domain-containing protein [Acidimicrobiia bacterium]